MTDLHNTKILNVTFDSMQSLKESQKVLEKKFQKNPSVLTNVLQENPGLVVRLTPPQYRRWLDCLRASNHTAVSLRDISSRVYEYGVREVLFDPSCYFGLGLSTNEKKAVICITAQSKRDHHIQPLHSETFTKKTRTCPYPNVYDMSDMIRDIENHRALEMPADDKDSHPPERVAGSLILVRRPDQETPLQNS